MSIRLMVAGLLIVVMVGCAAMQGSDKPSSDEAISIDTTGMTSEQQESARSMINDIVPLIREGKSEGEVITVLQEREAKKITRYRVEIGDSWTRGPDDAKGPLVYRRLPL